MDESVMVLSIVATLVGGMIAVAGIISYNWRRTKELGYAARLKQLMIERGLSADEIERVIRATPPTGNDREWEHVKDFCSPNQRRAG